MAILFFLKYTKNNRRCNCWQLKWECVSWMPGVTSVAGYGCWVKIVGLDVAVLWVSSSNEAPEAVLLDTSRRQVASPQAKYLSAWGQTA